jgi:pimeloyl-ACP methyl ester carboxylesterase
MRTPEKLSGRFVLIVFLATFLLSCQTQEPDYTKTPVFFVHGHKCSAKDWNRMISYLVRSGYPRQYLKAIQLHPNDGANIEAAEKQIAPAIEEFLGTINEYLKKEHPEIPLKTKVDLISHSMGALSARWYTVKVRPDRVRVWLSLVGVNHGTDALCGASGRGGAEMCPAYAKSREESFIQYELNGAPVADVDETPYGIGKDSPGVDRVAPDENRRILYVTVRVASDIFIKPGDSATLDGAGDIDILIPEKLQAQQTSPGNILVTAPLDHDGLLKNNDLLKLVKNILDIIHLGTKGDE